MHARDKEATGYPKAMCECLCVMGQGGGLCSFYIWGPTAETSEKPVVRDPRGSDLDLFWYSHLSQIIVPFLEAWPGGLFAACYPTESLVFQQGLVCRWCTYPAPGRAAWVTRVSNRNPGSKSSLTAGMPGPDKSCAETFGSKASISSRAKKSRPCWAEHPSAFHL